MDDGVGAPEDWRETITSQARDLIDRAWEFDPDTLTTRDVVGLAVGAAVALGTLMVALGPGETAPPTRGRARRDVGKEQRIMADEPMVAVIRNGKLTRRTRKQLHKQVNALQKEIDRLDKSIQKEVRKARRNAPPLQPNGDAAHLSEDLGKRLAAVGAATAAATAPLIERARHFEIPDQVRDGARQFAGSTREGARSFANTTRGRTTDLADRVRDEFVPLVVERASHLQDRVLEDVVPQVTAQFDRVRDEFVPQVAGRLQHVRDDLAPQVADAASRVGARASALAATGAATSRKAAKNLASGDLAEQVEKQTRRQRKRAAAALANAAQQIEPRQSRRGGIWIFAFLAALGGLIAYLLQDEERRNKVVATAKSVTEQGREIIRDFQGYDEEF